MADEKKPKPSATTPKVVDNMSKKRKAPELSDLDPAIVTITVNGKSFTLHKDLACYYSPVLAAAFKGKFVEGKTQSMDLEDTTQPAVALLVRWIYSGKIVDREDKLTTLQADMYELWMLADRLLIPELQNIAIDGLSKRISEENLIYSSEANRIYGNTSNDSPLRRFLADQLAFHLDTASLRKDLSQAPEGYCHELLRDIVLALKTKYPPIALRGLVAKPYTVAVPDNDSKE